MARDENLPFEQGTTQTASSANFDLLGKEYVIEDYNPSSGAVRSDQARRLRIVKNGSGFALLPKRMAAVSTTAGELGKVVKGYGLTTAAQAYPIDEYLPSAGVPDGELFYIVVGGPALVLTSLAGADANVINVNNWVVNTTGATSGATTAGRAEVANFNAATTVLADQLLNRIGQAVSAKTTANTNADLLIHVGRWT